MTYNDERDQLIMANCDLVRKIAQKLKADLPDRIDIDELIGYGYLVLVECAMRFDKSRCASFRTYAGHRIRGGIKDALYCEDMIPRAARRTAEKNGTSHRLPRVVSLDVPRESSSGDTSKSSWSDILIDRSPDVFTHLTQHEFPEDFTKTLQRRERQVLRLCFVDGMNTQGAADKLGLSQRAICRIRSQLVEQARDYYRQHGFSRMNA